MGGPYESSFGLGRRPLGPRLGEELRLELDPRIQAQLAIMLREGDIARARSYVLAPRWEGLDASSAAIFGARVVPSSTDPAPVPTFRPTAAPPIPLCPTSRPPDPPQPPNPNVEPPPPRPGSAKDVMDAVSRTQEWQCTAGRLFDTVERNALRDWRSLTTTEKVGVVTAGTVLASGVVAGVLSNDETRRLALDQLLGADIPVPLVRGMSVRILRADQAPGAPPPAENDTPRPVGVFFTLDVPKFLQNFQRLPSFTVGHF
jgi:hypothetical protein